MKDEYTKMIEKKRDYYSQMASMCNEVLEGTPTTQVCQKYGISVSNFRHKVLKAETKPLSLEITSETLIAIAEELMSPEERLLRDVLEFYVPKSAPKVFIEFPEDFEQSVDEVLHLCCDDRTYDIMRMRYFEEMSYDQIGERYNITKSRAQQIVKRTIRRLRRNDYLLRMLYGTARYTEYREQVDRSKYIENLMKNLRASKSKSEIYNSLEEQLDDIEDEFQNDFSLSIESLGLDVRTFNGLKRSGISMISQVVVMTDEELMKIRNFGIGCLKNLDQCLISRGFSRGV